jgi:hypothetical protein
MILKPLLSGQTIELRHPFGGASPLDLTAKLRLVKLTTEEVDLFRQVSQQKADLSAKAAQFSATKLRDELDAAKAAIAESEVTDEALENVARLAALATDPLVAKAVEREAFAAIEPALAKLDGSLQQICDRLINEVRIGLDKATAKFAVGDFLNYIEDEHMGQLAAFVADRIAASHALLDAWTAKAAQQGAQAFLQDDRAAT